MACKNIYYGQFSMKKYIPQLDYLKSVFIVLMILFHLIYIGDTYPYLKKVVYTFHMPIFLILSGYLSGTNKNVKAFMSSLGWLFIPYAIMEMGYVVAASILPVREEVGELGFMNILTRVFIDPVGPYWYIHTLLLCRLIHFVVNKVLQYRVDNLALLIVLGFSFWGIAQGINLMSFSYSMCFLIGVGIRTFNLNFLTLFSPSWWSVIPLLVLCSYPDNLLKFNLAGCVIVYSTISFFLWVYAYLPKKVNEVSIRIGKNTLSILLFSPVFTMLSRIYQPFLMLDPWGICFASFTLVLTIVGCLGITLCMDKLGISPYFFGQHKMLKI